MNSRRWIWGSLLVGFIAVGLLVFLLLSAPDHPFFDEKDGVFGGDFQLDSARGEIALEDFRGQIVLLYFGFLNCPEVCPASMGVFQQSLNKLAAQELEQVQPILISIDPQRDTVESLQAFTGYFHPKILGLTGSLDQIEQVAKDYGAYFKLTEAEEQSTDYVFRHSSRYYVINQQGKLVDAMRHSTTANELVARIRTLLPPNLQSPTLLSPLEALSASNESKGESPS